MTDFPQTKIRMTREEFLTLPETNVPHELIDGELIVSPTPKHPHQQLLFKLAKYIEQLTLGGEVVISPIEVHFDDGNIVEPDIFWVSGPESKCKLGADGYWYGAPDLIVEVLSPSTEARDRKAKFELYEKLGVRQYWLAHPEAHFFEVFALAEGRFVRKELFEAGQTFASDVLGQQVDISAILGSKR